MANEKIKRFCELVFEINGRNRILAEARAKFYDGGYSFEECHGYELEELESRENELLAILPHLLNQGEKPEGSVASEAS